MKEKLVNQEKSWGNELWFIKKKSLINEEKVSINQENNVEEIENIIWGVWKNYLLWYVYTSVGNHPNSAKSSDLLHCM